ncbi:DNA primase [Salmonella enterica subsp. enterica]|nr:DNA primase [Salmonella enterica subsp. enterica serovar Soumbedioune]EEC0856809.1 DNA primase [Salmonella enterica subsp. enterica serovar Soumbedioune]EIB1167338.1 toprim domain-containing protein [Salmonella enterica]EIE8532319.1 toprim domain-containing protein [Salmonella enterica]EMC8019392.1 toprim domain-containing protein [Salmonella enterica]
MTGKTVSQIAAEASGRWCDIFPLVGVNIPEGKKHGPCPVCGGKDRFRMDDKNGRGDWICNQCGNGDGLDLVRRVHNTSIMDAARRVSEAIGNAPASEKLPVAGESVAGNRQTAGGAERDGRGTQTVRNLMKYAVMGESHYLTAKGLPGHPVPLLKDGSILLTLRDAGGVVRGGQLIRANGEKRLLSGTAKRGAFIPVVDNLPDTADTVIIAEGFASAVSAAMLARGVTVAALDAGNMLHVARAMREKYPCAQIIMAADNDWYQPGETDEHGKPRVNTGKMWAEKAAAAVGGLVSLPPTEHKADWNDYFHQHGIDAAALAFRDGCYSPVKPAAGTGRQANFVEKKPVQQHGDAPDLYDMAASERAELLSQRYQSLALRAENDVVHHYDGTVWRPLPDSELKRVMADIYRQNTTKFSAGKIASTVDTLKLMLPLMGEQAQNLIGFRNGVYNMETLSFRPHSENDWMLNHNGVEFLPPCDGENIREHAPAFWRWLNHAAYGSTEKMRRICAALYMVMTNRHNWQLFVEVTGAGGSGKSVFTHIARQLVGENNVASCNMASMDTARGRAPLTGKSLIILPDQPRYVGEGTGIKAITGGDLVEVDAKYEKPYSTIIRAVVLATNNEPMVFTERNGGIARRRVIFVFDAEVPKAERDEQLPEKISAEIPVIIRHLLREFPQPEQARQQLMEQLKSVEALAIKRRTNPVIDLCGYLLFMTEPKGMMLGGGKFVAPEPKTYLYHLYLAFAEYYGLKNIMTVESFSKAVREAAREYGSEYLTRKVKGYTQTNVSIAQDAGEFLPRAWGCKPPDDD